MNCEICEYADEQGSWPPDHRGTHCRGCHRSWSGLKEIHCVVCHEHFSTDSNLTLHKDGTNCIPPQDVKLQNGKFALKGRVGPYGVTWVREGEPWKGPETVQP